MLGVGWVGGWWGMGDCGWVGGAKGEKLGEHVMGLDGSDKCTDGLFLGTGGML